MSKFNLPEPEDEYDIAILADIERVGWSVIQVNPDNGDDTEPLFSFSVGLLQTFDHPEIIMIGLSHESAGAIINEIGFVVENGERIKTGRVYEEFAGVPVAFVIVDKAHFKNYVGYAVWLYDGSDFPLLQCVWPLKSGHFPWDKGYDPAAARFQPLLGK